MKLLLTVNDCIVSLYCEYCVLSQISSHESFATSSTFNNLILLQFISFVAVHTTFMSLQVAGVTETFVTLSTLVRLLSLVHFEVFPYNTATCKRHAAHVTLVRFLSRMDPYVIH